MLEIRNGAPTPRIDLQSLARQPLVLNDPKASGRVKPGDGSVSFVLPPGPARVIVIREFYFPSWRAHCDSTRVPIVPYGPGRLVALRIPANAHVCALTIGWTPQEFLGWGVMLVSLVLLATLGLTTRGRRRATDRTNPRSLEASA
jgi:hypothetical protein